MADTNDGGEKTPTRDGPATGAGPVRMGVYDQPAKQATAASPLTRILPILIALAVLGFLLYRFVLARPAATDTGANTTTPAASTTETTSGTSGMSGSGSGTSSSTSGSGATSPPGPRGAAGTSGSGGSSGAGTH